METRRVETRGKAFCFRGKAVRCSSRFPSNCGIIISAGRLRRTGGWVLEVQWWSFTLETSVNTRYRLQPTLFCLTCRSFSFTPLKKMVLDIQSWKLILNCAYKYLIYIRRSSFCGIYRIILSEEKKGTDPESK